MSRRDSLLRVAVLVVCCTLAVPAAGQPAADESPCVSDPTTLCLAGDRFRVTLGPGAGAPPSLLPEAGFAIRRNDDWGHFSLFRPHNVEAVVKILDGQAVNGHSWLFVSVLSHLPLAVQVTDTVTGTEHRLDTSSGQRTFFDTTAFPAGPHPPLGRRPPPLPPAHGALSCDDDPFCVSLHDGRIEVDVAHYPGGSQAHSAAWRQALTRSAAAFGYSRPGTADVVVKVLDGRPVNGHWWVFVGMLTHRGAEVTVVDTATGAHASYFTADENLTDTLALPAP